MITVEDIKRMINVGDEIQFIEAGLTKDAVIYIPFYVIDEIKNDCILLNHDRRQQFSVNMNKLAGKVIETQTITIFQPENKMHVFVIRNPYKASDMLDLRTGGLLVQQNIQNEGKEYITCPTCQGEGYINKLNYVKSCDDCKGSGEEQCENKEILETLNSFAGLTNKMTDLLVGHGTHILNLQDEVAKLKADLLLANQAHDKLHSEFDANVKNTKDWQEKTNENVTKEFLMLGEYIKKVLESVLAAINKSQGPQISLASKVFGKNKKKESK